MNDDLDNRELDERELSGHDSDDRALDRPPPRTGLWAALWSVTTLLLLEAWLFWLMGRGPGPVAPPFVPPAAVNQKPQVFDESLPGGAVARLGTLRMRTSGVSWMRFAPDGQSLETYTYNGGRRWDLVTGMWVAGADIRYPNAVSGMQNRMATMGEAGRIRIHETDKFEIVSECQHPNANERSWSLQLAFSDDGGLLASASADGEVRLWDAATGRQVQRWQSKKHDNLSSFDTAVSPGGAAVALVFSRWGAEEEKVVYCWDAATGALRFTVPNRPDHSDGFDTAAFVSDDVLVTAHQGLEVCWWNAVTGDLLQRDDFTAEFQGNTYTSVALFVYPERKLLVMGGLDGVVRIWDTTTRQIIRRFEGHGKVLSVALSPDGKTLAAANGWGGAIRLWDVETGREVRPRTGHVAPVNAIAFSRSGKHVISGGDDYTVRLWDLTTGEQIVCLQEGHAAVHSVAFDGADILAGGSNDYVRWQAQLVRFAPQRAEHYHSRFVTAPRPRLLAKLGSVGSEITVENLDDGKVVTRLPASAEQYHSGLALAADGSLVAAYRSVWSVPAGALKYELRFEPARKPNWENDQTNTVKCLDFSPNSRWLASGGVDGAWRLWENATGQELFCSKDLGVAVDLVAFAPDGRLLATVSSRCIQLWDVLTGRLVHSFPQLDCTINGLAYSADGTQLASANEDSTILVWDLRAAAAKLHRPLTPQNERQLSQRWEELLAVDGRVAFAAIGTMAGSPDTSRKFILERLRRQHDEDSAGLDDVPRWLDILARRDPDARDRAYRELEKLGDRAGPALRAALAKRPDDDTAFRLERLLRDLQDEKLTPQRVRLLRALAVLEEIADEPTRKELARLGAADPATWVSREAGAGAARVRILTARGP